MDQLLFGVNKKLLGSPLSEESIRAVVSIACQCPYYVAQLDRRLGSEKGLFMRVANQALPIAKTSRLRSRDVTRISLVVARRFVDLDKDGTHAQTLVLLLGRIKAEVLGIASFFALVDVDPNSILSGYHCLGCMNDKTMALQTGAISTIFEMIELVMLSFKSFSAWTDLVEFQSLIFDHPMKILLDCPTKEVALLSVYLEFVTMRAAMAYLNCSAWTEWISERHDTYQRQGLYTVRRICNDFLMTKETFNLAAGISKLFVDQVQYN